MTLRVSGISSRDRCAGPGRTVFRQYFAKRMGQDRGPWTADGGRAGNVIGYWRALHSPFLRSAISEGADIPYPLFFLFDVAKPGMRSITGRRTFLPCATPCLRPCSVIPGSRHHRSSDGIPDAVLHLRHLGGNALDGDGASVLAIVHYEDVAGVILFHERQGLDQWGG